MGDAGAGAGAVVWARFGVLALLLEVVVVVVLLASGEAAAAAAFELLLSFLAGVAIIGSLLFALWVGEWSHEFYQHADSD